MLNGLPASCVDLGGEPRDLRLHQLGEPLQLAGSMRMPVRSMRASTPVSGRSMVS